MRTDDTPLTEEEQIAQDNLTASVCDNARKRLAEQPANPPERYRGKIVLGVNEIPKYLNEQAAQGYSLCQIITEDGYIYVLVERDTQDIISDVPPDAMRKRRRVFLTADEQKFMADAERPPHWE